MDSLKRRFYRLSRQFLMFCAIEAIARLLYISGILFLIGFVRQRIGRPRLLIPMYHRVSQGASEPHCVLDVQQGVPLQLFREQLRILRWFGPLLKLNDAFDQLHAAKPTARSFVAVTFDDGYLDNVTLALPLLQSVGATATIFPVVRTASGGRPLWWDELTAILTHTNRTRSEVTAALEGLGGCPALRTVEQQIGPGSPRKTIADFLCERWLELPSSKREGALDLLSSRLQIGDVDRRARRSYASWHDLQAAARTCEIGGHTSDHVVLTCEDPETAQSQICGSRAILETQMGQPISSFAYPNGRHDAAIRTLTNRAGYRLAVTVQPGVNYQETDPFELRRVPIHRERPFHLAFKLAFYAWAHHD